MNSVEVMEGKLAVVELRLRRLELVMDSRAHLSQDDREAREIATTLGLEPDVIFFAGAAGPGPGIEAAARDLARERRTLAVELRARGWSATRMARVFGCSDRTVQRWFE